MTVSGRFKGHIFSFVLISYAAIAGAEELVIPGSGAPEYVLGQLAEAFNHAQSLHHVVVPTTTGTAGALRDVTDGQASMGRVGRPLRDSELKSGLTYYPLGRDPIAFVGGAEVTVRRLSRDQTIAVYSGELTRWSDLGGQSRSIRAIGREASDSSFQAIAREISQFDNIQFAENVKVVHLDTQMIELLDRFPTSIGFLNRSALSAAKTKLVLFALDSVEPSAENMASGKYPLWTELALIYKKNSLTESGKAFLNFVQSPKGVELLRVNGVTPAVPLR